MNSRRHISLVGPTLLVGLGVILLLNNLGYLDWSFWDIIRLWPILLIAAGLEVLLGRRSGWASAIAALLVLAMVAGGAWFLSRSDTTGTRGQIRELAYPRGVASAATIVLEPSVGALSVGTLADSSSLVEATIRLLPNEELTERFVEGERARLTLARSSGPVSSYGLSQSAVWNVAIDPEVRLDLTADLGAGEATIDLAGLQADRVQVDLGVGQVKVTLPRESDAEVIVDGGVGTVTISIPRGLGAKIRVDAGIVARDLPAGFTRSGDTYTSPTYQQADYQAEVTVSLGIGTIVVHEVDPDQ